MTPSRDEALRLAREIVGACDLPCDAKTCALDQCALARALIESEEECGKLRDALVDTEHSKRCAFYMYFDDKSCSCGRAALRREEVRE